MPTSLTGSPVDPTSNPQATVPVDGDAANASSVNGAFQALLDFVSWIRGKMVRNDANNTVGATTTFSNPVNVATATAAAHAVRKDQLDSEATARSNADATLTPRASKAWGKLTLGASGAVTVTEGANIANASWSGNILTINLSAALGSANCAIFATHHWYGGIQLNGILRCGTNSTSQIWVGQYNLTNADALNLVSGAIIDVVVFGA